MALSLKCAVEDNKNSFKDIVYKFGGKLHRKGENNRVEPFLSLSVVYVLFVQ